MVPTGLKNAVSLVLVPLSVFIMCGNSYRTWGRAAGNNLTTQPEDTAELACWLYPSPCFGKQFSQLISPLKWLGVMEVGLQRKIRIMMMNLAKF